jgi:predicted metal-dependent hydrolase
VKRSPSSLDRRYLKFIELFNQESFFEAHEVLEGLWREDKGPSRDFYHGLIQIAAALVHMKKDTPEGAAKLLKKASRYLEKYPATYLRLNWTQIFSQAKKCVLHGEVYPRIFLES